MLIFVAEKKSAITFGEGCSSAAVIVSGVVMWPLWDLLRIYLQDKTYRQVSNIRRTLTGNYHSDAVGASPVGAAPTTSSFST